MEVEQPLPIAEEVGESFIVSMPVIEKVETDPIECVETNVNAPEEDGIVILTDGEEEAEKVLPGRKTAEPEATAVRTYQRRPAREETSEKRSEEERLREGPSQRTGGYVESPARSAARSPVRRRRLLMDEEPEEEDDVFFLPLEELSSQKQLDASAEANDSDKERRERKRKGKTIAAPAKKKPRQSPTTLVIQERYPNEVRQEETGESDEDEALRFELRSKMRYDEVRSTSEQRPGVAIVQFEKIHIRLDNQLLRQMIRFEDPKMDD